MLLGSGDSIFVPEAGVVFVEGAVNNPGQYSLRGGTGILEAIAMAQGTTYDAEEDKVQVVTRGDDGQKAVVSVPLDKVRAQEAPNLELQDGDIVLVPSNAVKRNFAGFWRGFRGVFGMGFSLNGP
jgi:polysaccharide biosynthesis/export protein